jgi:hypothetical protein
MLISNTNGASPSFKLSNWRMDRMTLLQSICCLFAGRCSEEERKPRKDTARGDLGQTEAELEKTGKERMEHMEGAKPK